MILTCPACATRYVIPDETFSAGSRSVRCAKCSHQWQAEPPADTPAPKAPAADEAPAAGTEEAAAPERDAEAAVVDAGDAGEAAAEEGDGWTEIAPPTETPLAAETAPAAAMALRPGRLPRRSTPAWVWVGWAALVVVVAGIAGGVLFARDTLVAAWPPAERLYAVLGGPLTAAAREQPVTLVIESSELVTEGGRQRIDIVLRLTNLTDATQAPPVAVIHLIDDSGRDIRTERIHLPEAPLTPKESRQLRLRLDDVPAGLKRVRGEAVPAS